MDPIYGNWKTLRTATVRQGYLFEINYHAQESRYEDYLPTVQKMIDSLSIFGTKQYSNIASGMSIRYLSNWKVSEENSTSPSFNPAIKTLFYLPQEINRSSINNRHEILKYISVSDVSLDELANRTIESTNLTYWKYPNFTVIEQPRFNIEPFRLFSFQYTDPISRKEVVRVTQFLIEVNGNIYDFSYIVKKDQYTKYLQTIAHMINSLKFFQFNSYESFKLGAAFEYPSNWKIIYDQENEIYLRPEEELDPSLRIFSEVVGIGTSLDDFVSETINSYSKGLEQKHNFFLITNVSSMLSNYPDLVPTRILNYSYSDRDLGIINNTEIIVKNGLKIFHILFSSPQGKYLDHLPAALKTADSVRLIDVENTVEFRGKPSGIMLIKPVEWSVQNSTLSHISDISNLSELESDPQAVRLSIVPYIGNITQLDYDINASLSKSNLTDYETSITTVYTNLDNNTVAHKKVYTQNITHYNSNVTEANFITIFYTVFKNNVYLISHNDTYEYDRNMSPSPEKLLNLSSMYLNSLIDANGYSTNNEYIRSIIAFNKDNLDLSNILDSLTLIESLPIETRLKQIDGYDFSIKIPDSWKDIHYNQYLISARLNSSNSDLISISSQTLPNMNLFDIVKNDLQGRISDNPTTFRIIKSERTTNGDKLIYTVEYEVQGSYDVSHNFIKYIQYSKDRLYILSYENVRDSSSNPGYYAYLPEVNHLFATFSAKDIGGSKFRSQTGFTVGKLPSGVVFNPVTNIIYVVNTGSDTVSVLDGNTYNILITITVGRTPQGIALDAAFNTIYVANIDSHSVTVIDGSNNSVKKTIPVGPSPLAIAADSITHQVYVADETNNTIFAINGPEAERAEPIHTGTGIRESNIGVDIAVNELTGFIYFISDPYHVTVIDGGTKKVINSIAVSVGNPLALAINPITNMAYVLGQIGNLSKIDLGKNREVSSTDLKWGNFNSLALNRITGMLYAPDVFGHTVRLIHPDFAWEKAISVDPSPYYAAIDEDRNMIFVTSSNYGTMNLISGSKNDLLYRVKFGTQLEPIDLFYVAGIPVRVNVSQTLSIYCDNNKIINNILLYDNISVSCEVRNDNPLVFIIGGIWSGSDPASPNSVFQKVQQKSNSPC